MSVHVLSWVLKKSPAEKADRLVLLVLADKAGDEGAGARPAVTTIQCEARLRGRSTVQAALRTLERAGAIERLGIHKDTGCMEYRVSLDLAEQNWADVYPEWEDPKAKHQAQRERERARRQDAETEGHRNRAPLPGAQKTSPQGHRKRPAGGTGSVPNPSIEPSKDPKPPSPLASKGERNRWIAFLEDCKSHYPELTWYSWIRPLELAERRDDTLVVAGPTAEWVSEAHADHLRELATGHYGPNVELEFRVPAKAENERATIAAARQRRRAEKARREIGAGK